MWHSRRATLHTVRRREIVTVRGQSYVFRLPKYWPPTPLSARWVCTPRLCSGRTTHSPGGEGVGGQYFGRRKTQLCTLPISNPLCCTLSVQQTLKSSALSFYRHSTRSCRLVSRWWRDAPQPACTCGYPPSSSPWRMSRFGKQFLRKNISYIYVWPCTSFCLSGSRFCAKTFHT